MTTATIAFIDKNRKRLYRWAYILALITIVYNLCEGIVSIYFGIDDDSFALFGFGLDSFVEVISGVGIWHMVIRTMRNEKEDPDRFEKTALKITGSSFYLLTAGLTAAAVFNLARGHRPETTFWGIVVSLVSILSMWLLIRAKKSVGAKLDSPAILADAACTRTCMQLSVALLISSIGYEVTGIGGLDAAGAVIIAWLSFKEGGEAFERAAAGSFACRCSGKCGAQKP